MQEAKKPSWKNNERRIFIYLAENYFSHNPTAIILMEKSYQNLCVFNKIKSVKNYFLAKIFSLKYQTVSNRNEKSKKQHSCQKFLLQIQNFQRNDEINLWPGETHQCAIYYTGPTIRRELTIVLNFPCRGCGFGFCVWPPKIPTNFTDF